MQAKRALQSGKARFDKGNEQNDLSYVTQLKKTDTSTTLLPVDLRRLRKRHDLHNIGESFIDIRPLTSGYR